MSDPKNDPKPMSAKPASTPFPSPKPKPASAETFDALRRAAFAAAPLTGDGLRKVYVVGVQKAYRNGRLYSEGELIELPIDEAPSATFTAAPSRSGKDAA